MNGPILSFFMKTTIVPRTPGPSGPSPAWGLAILFLALATQVRAGDLEIRLTAQRVLVEPNGQERLQSADRAFPGDTVQYEAIYENRGVRPIRNLQPTLPIPTGMSYLADTAQPAPAEASLDGRHFEAVPLKRQVKLANGEVREEFVPPSEYRALRWLVGNLPTAGQTNVIARTRLAPASPRPGLVKN